MTALENQIGTAQLAETMAEAPVNWCPELGTVLANEEVIDGKSEVGGFPVIRKPMRQWMLRITAHAERLLNGKTDPRARIALTDDVQTRAPLSARGTGDHDGQRSPAASRSVTSK